MWMALPVALVILSAPTKAKLAVVELEAPPTMIGLAGQVTDEVVRVAKSQGLSVIAPEDVREKLGPKNYDELQKCGNKPLCVAGRLGSFYTVERVVVGSLNRDEKNYLLKLWLLDLDKMVEITDVDLPILIASRRFTHDVNAVVPAFLRGEREPRGRIEVTCNVKNASATLDGEPVTLPFKFEMKPGKHELKVEKKHYLPVTRLLTVEAGQTTHDEVRLILKPGESDEDELPPVVTDNGKKNEGGPSLRIPAAAWVLGGLAVVGGGAGAAFGLRSTSTQRELTDGYDPTTDTYQGTRKDALRAQSDATLANVGFAVGGAALIGAVVVTLVSQGDEPKTEVAPVGVAPVAGPGGGGLLITGHF